MILNGRDSIDDINGRFWREIDVRPPFTHGAATRKSRTPARPATAWLQTQRKRQLEVVLVFSAAGLLLMGSNFAPEEERRVPGPARVVVLSEAAWRNWFGADPKILTREIRLNGVPRRVIGVMPAQFVFPDPGIKVWLPLRLNYDSLWTRNNHYLLTVGRLKPGASATEQEYIDWCRQNLARFKIPKKVVFGPVPTTATVRVYKGGALIDQQTHLFGLTQMTFWEVGSYTLP